MKEAFIHKNFRDSTLAVIANANVLVEQYLADDMKLTLRQLYYRFVAMDLFPDERRWAWTGSKWKRDPDGTKNAQPNYNWLGSIINDARLCGYIDWEALEDRARSLEGWPAWKDPAHALAAVRSQYSIDKWKGQDFRVEVWVEKQALEAIVERACGPTECKYMACKGYMSQSEMYEAAKRFHRYAANNQTPAIIHLGDHDPSGIDMTRDIDDRLEMFGMPMEVKRIALNMDQVDQYEPPPSPAKLTDSRVAGYIQRFGHDSWELDALEPHVLVELIQKTIDQFVDPGKWNERVAEEDAGRELLVSFEEQAAEQNMEE